MGLLEALGLSLIVAVILYLLTAIAMRNEGDEDER